MPQLVKAPAGGSHHRRTSSGPALCLFGSGSAAHASYTPEKLNISETSPDRPSAAMSDLERIRARLGSLKARVGHVGNTRGEPKGDATRPRPKGRCMSKNTPTVTLVSRSLMPQASTPKRGRKIKSPPPPPPNRAAAATASPTSSADTLASVNTSVPSSSWTPSPVAGVQASKYTAAIVAHPPHVQVKKLNHPPPPPPRRSTIHSRPQPARPTAHVSQQVVSRSPQTHATASSSHPSGPTKPPPVLPRLRLGTPTPSQMGSSIGSSCRETPLVSPACRPLPASSPTHGVETPHHAAGGLLRTSPRVAQIDQEHQAGRPRRDTDIAAMLEAAERTGLRSSLEPPRSSRNVIHTSVDLRRSMAFQELMDAAPIVALMGDDDALTARTDDSAK